MNTSMSDEKIETEKVSPQEREIFNQKSVNPPIFFDFYDPSPNDPIFFHHSNNQSNNNSQCFTSDQDNMNDEPILQTSPKWYKLTLKLIQAKAELIKATKKFEHLLSLWQTQQHNYSQQEIKLIC